MQTKKIETTASHASGTMAPTTPIQYVTGHHTNDKGQSTRIPAALASGTLDNAGMSVEQAKTAAHWAVTPVELGYEFQGAIYLTLEALRWEQHRLERVADKLGQEHVAEFWESHGGQPKPVTRDYSLRRTLLESWRNDRWRPFGSFVGLAWSDLSGDHPQPEGMLYTWRILRPRVLRELAALGLVGSVRLTNGEIEPLAEHDGRVAGHVVIAAIGQVSETTGVPETAYERHLGELYGLTPHSGMDTGLRAFCGQSTAPDDDPHGLSAAPDDHVLDHSRTWLDRYGYPVLTAELYGFGDRPEYVDELKALFGQLPLSVKAAGVLWDDVLHEVLVIRHDPEKPPLSSEWKVADAEFAKLYGEAAGVAALENVRVGDWQARKIAAIAQQWVPALSGAARRHLRWPPSAGQVQGFLDYVRGKRVKDKVPPTQAEQWERLDWVAEMLCGYVAAGHLSHAVLEHLIRGLAREIGLADEQVPDVIETGWRRCAASLEKEAA